MTYIMDLFRKRVFLIELGTRDFKSAYFGSVFGLLWSFVEPTVYVALLYVFVGKVAKFNAGTNELYLPWLMCGMMAWTFFSSSILSGARIFKKYSYLLKRRQFDMSLLAITNVISSYLVHCMFLVLTIAVMLFLNVPIRITWLEYFYYILAAATFITAMTWIVASLSVFIQDVENALSLLMQIGFWTSPIFWNIDFVPEKYQFLVKLNPAYYIIVGCRNCFLYGIHFWETPKETLYFWTLTIVLLIIGRLIYRRLRPQFGDVING